MYLNYEHAELAAYHARKRTESAGTPEEAEAAMQETIAAAAASGSVYAITDAVAAVQHYLRMVHAALP